jgi:predicted small secreted protein
MSVTFDELLGETQMRSLMIAFLLVASVIALSGCETIKGAGRDITNAGEALEDAVR